MPPTRMCFFFFLRKVSFLESKRLVGKLVIELYFRFGGFIEVGEASQDLIGDFGL